MDTNTIPAANTASGIVLTIKGEAYCEATRQFKVNGVPLPDGVTPAEWRKAVRARIEQHLDCVKSLVDALDFLSDDPDKEANGDDEPALGWPAGGQINLAMTQDDDREQDDSDAEDGGDDEPNEDDEPDHEAAPEYPDDPSKPQYLPSIRGGNYLTVVRSGREGAVK